MDAREILVDAVERYPEIKECWTPKEWRDYQRLRKQMKKGRK